MNLKENETLDEFRADDEVRDEPDIEIIDLDEGKPRWPRFQAFQKGPGRWLFSRESRRLRSIVLAVISTLTIGALLFNVTPVGALFLQFIPKPVQMTFNLTLDATPGWGELQIDGQRATLNYHQNYPLFRISRGQHTLRWLAAPFSPQSCVITLPTGTGTDTCSHPDFAPSIQNDLTSYILFFAQLDQLSSANQQALFNAVQITLDHMQSSDTVQAGDIYAQTVEVPGPDPRTCKYTVINAAFCFVKAKQPLLANLNLQLDRDLPGVPSCNSNSCQASGQICRTFCSVLEGSGQNSLRDPSVWQPLVRIRTFWQFSHVHGETIVAQQPNSFILGAQNDHLLPLMIRWTGQQWKVTGDVTSSFTVNSNPICDAAYGDLYTLLFATQPPDALPQLVPGADPAFGCLIKIPQEASFQFNSNAPALPLATAYVVQRFGVLLAVNNVAHLRWPFLPVADASTQKLVKEWSAKQNWRSP